MLSDTATRAARAAPMPLRIFDEKGLYLVVIAVNRH